MIFFFLIIIFFSAQSNAQTPQMVKDMNPGTADGIRKDEVSFPFESKFAHVNGRLFFACSDGVVGHELCTSDGSAQGTFIVRDINTGSADAFHPDNERSAGIAIGSKYIFRALNGNKDELWVSGGCDKNTYRLRTLNSGSSFIRTFRSSPSIPGKAFFFASLVGPEDSELYETDGTSAGTKIAVDACTTVGCGGAWGADDMGFLGSKVYFSASSTAHEITSSKAQLWQYDSATGQGRQFATLNPLMDSTPDGMARGFVNAGNYLVFAAHDGGSQLNRLWRTDGVSTTKLSNTIDGIVPPMAATDDGSVYFMARDQAAGNELHRAIPAQGTASLVKDLIVGFVHGWAEEITSMGSYILFRGDKELFRSDGSGTGTTLVKDINEGSSLAAAQSNPSHFMRVSGGQMVFSGDDGIHGRELWITSGTPASTRMLADINPGPSSSEPQDFTMIGGVLYFSASTATHGRELWRVQLSTNNVPAFTIQCPAQQMMENAPPLAPDQGVCCQPNSCMSTSEAQCVSQGGVFKGGGTNCATHGVQCNDSSARGVCCTGESSPRCLTNRDADSCFGTLHIGGDCSTCFGGGAPTPATNPGQLGNCCKNGCFQQHSATSCAEFGGNFIGTQECLVCFQDPNPETRGSCCVNGGCLLQHTAASCAALSGNFIGSQQCAVCFQDPGPGAPPAASCKPEQVQFCATICGGANRVLGCECNGDTVSPVCPPVDTPVAPTNAPVPTSPPTLPVGATTFAFPTPDGSTQTGRFEPTPQTMPNGTPFTQSVVPVTSPNGNTVTNGNGVPATQIITPQTDSSGRFVPGGSTMILTDAPLGGNVIGNPQDACTPIEESACEQLCESTSVQKCDCTGTKIDGQCFGVGEVSNTKKITISVSLLLLGIFHTMF